MAPILVTPLISSYDTTSPAADQASRAQQLRIKPTLPLFLLRCVKVVARCPCSQYSRALLTYDCASLEGGQRHVAACLICAIFPLVLLLLVVEKLRRFCDVMLRIENG